ncbi:SixA phosphatase family protein [Croceivirga radicis]|uniref:SixA phosphatase family protein n=1 Tax=Croceivirga radicis TaxID=1929488 RepID=UPI000255AE72|nr:phosphoglycerate mutase family protein [Croceivirga radicis]
MKNIEGKTSNYNLFHAMVMLLCFLTFLSCKEDKKQEPPKDPVITTFYLIRHAEKDRSNPEDKDPELNQDGLGRAMLWANMFDTLDLDAVYSTDYTRTKMTAAPTSVKHNIDIKIFDPKEIDVKQLLLDNYGASVLMVGHSNTTPALANKLIGEEKYQSMDDNDNSSVYIIKLADSIGNVVSAKIQKVD